MSKEYLNNLREQVPNLKYPGDHVGNELIKELDKTRLQLEKAFALLAEVKTEDQTPSWNNKLETLKRYSVLK